MRGGDVVDFAVDTLAQTSRNGGEEMSLTHPGVDVSVALTRAASR